MCGGGGGGDAAVPRSFALSPIGSTFTQREAIKRKGSDSATVPRRAVSQPVCFAGGKTRSSSKVLLRVSKMGAPRGSCKTSLALAARAQSPPLRHVPSSSAGGAGRGRYVVWKARGCRLLRRRGRHDKVEGHAAAGIATTRVRRIQQPRSIVAMMSRAPVPPNGSHSPRPEAAKRR